jgi:hypothetical protein
MNYICHELNFYVEILSMCLHFASCHLKELSWTVKGVIKQKRRINSGGHANEIKIRMIFNCVKEYKHDKNPT